MRTLIKRLTMRSLPHQAIFYLFCFCFYHVSAQNNPYNEVSIASPTAASLGKYVDVPVSKHTGIPQISIPIYTIKEGPLQLPISLSYHAGGLKVMEPASWVGAGWSLNAGGVITRTVQGAPDERMTSSVDNQDKGHFSNYGFNSYLYEGLDMNGKPLAYWQPFAEGRKDGEPDLFFFNFAGYSGKFFFRDDRTPILVPEQDIKIEADYPGSGSIQSFTLTTPDGVRYYFGKTPSTSDTDPIEKTNPYTAQGGLSNGNLISSWYLNKIASADGLFAINLTYAAENYGYYTLSMFPLTGDDMYTLTTTGNNFEYNLVKNIVNGVRLSGISFSNGNISFTASTTRDDLSNTLNSLTPESVNTEAKRLDAIDISDNKGFCKKYVFSYSYFDDNASSLKGYFSSYNIQTDRKRLKLDSLQEKSCDGTVSNPPHVFEYFAELVPRRLSFGQDHWGFYNGVTSNNSLIPTYTVNESTTVTGANRDASWPAMRGGILKKITYPTGGFSDFDFEANSTWISYSQPGWVTKLALSAGWGGSSTPYIANLTVSGNDCKVYFKNYPTGDYAYLNIYNSSNQLVRGWALAPSQTMDQTIQLAAGTYRVELYKNTTVTSNGTEANFQEWTYSSIQKNETVGGLRIKTITQSDGFSAQNIVTSFSYLDNAGKSTAILYSRPTYVQAIRNDMISQLGYWNPSTGYTPSCSFNGCAACDGGFLPFFKSPSSVRPMETTQGAHIGYSEVKVSQSGNGYSVYRYFGTNPWSMSNDDVAFRKINTTDCNSSIPNYPAAPLAEDFRRGELSYEGHFSESGQILKEAYYNPVYQTSTAVNTPALIVATFQKGSTMQYLGTRYQLTTAKKTQTQTTETLYQPGGGSITTTDTLFYQSPYHAQLTKKVSTSSKGETIESIVKYAADFRLSSCDAIADCSQAYANSCTTCLTQYNTTNSACSTSSCRTNAYLDYQYCLTQARISFVSCRQNYTSSFSSCLQTAKSSADAELKPILELQGQNDFSPIEVAEWRSGKLLKASFNRFDYVSNPAGKVYLNKTQLISIVTPTTGFTSASVSGSTIVKDSRYKDEDLLKFDGGNLVELTKKNGVVTTYIWGYGNGNASYPIAKVTGASFSSVNPILNQSILWNPSTDQALRDELNKIRVQLPGALVSSYTYSRLQGITSETDARGQVFFYEYDKLGRLLYVRDDKNNILKKYSYNIQQSQ